MTATDVERARLYWQCRRGMRELDLLLRGFLDQHYADLDPGQRERLEELLAYPDTLLLEILMGRQRPTQTPLAELADWIRATGAGEAAHGD